MKKPLTTETQRKTIKPINGSRNRFQRRGRREKSGIRPWGETNFSGFSLRLCVSVVDGSLLYGLNERLSG
jgi:hypothetical protein